MIFEKKSCNEHGLQAASKAVFWKISSFFSFPINEMPINTSINVLLILVDWFPLSFSTTLKTVNSQKLYWFHISRQRKIRIFILSLFLPVCVFRGGQELLEHRTRSNLCLSSVFKQIHTLGKFRSGNKCCSLKSSLLSTQLKKRQQSEHLFFFKKGRFEMHMAKINNLDSRNEASGSTNGVQKQDGP
ncbi:unnamed protein product [Lepidochelys olivacea]